jgi:sterol 3beta-glucosyltransferase
MSTTNQLSPATITRLLHPLVRLKGTQNHQSVPLSWSPSALRFHHYPSTSEASARSSIDAGRKSWDVRRSMDASRMFRRPSDELRRSFSRGRHSVQTTSRAGDRSPLSPRATDTESATTSLERDTESSAAIQSIDESNASASQILNRSDVFRAPVNHSTVTASDQSGPLARYSQDTTRSSGRCRQPLKPMQHLSCGTRNN